MIRRVLFGFIFCMQMLSCRKIYAAVMPFKGEGVEFDADGNLWMVSHDRAAVSGTRYATIGWTIKRCDRPPGENESVRVKLESYCPDVPDPENPGYVYVYFVIHKDMIYRSIKNAYPKWAQELYTNGGTVYLDGIMTVAEKGIKKGYMSENGGLYGEVYTDYEGIAGARKWLDKEGLKTHFGKKVSFPANPGMLEPQPEMSENTELVTVTSAVYGEDVTAVNRMRIYSEQFDVERAVPSGETVTAEGNFQTYYYKAVYEHHYGKKAIPVTANVTYTLIWNDGTLHEEQVTEQRTAEVVRPYSYWKIKDIDFYYLKEITVKNGAFPDGEITIDTCYEPDVILCRETGGMTLPNTFLEISGGVVNGGNKKPSVPEDDIFLSADSAVGKITVKNDIFSVDGELWLDGNEREEKTEAPVTLSGGRTFPVRMESVLIPSGKENGLYGSLASATYVPYFSDGEEKEYAVSVNDVIVHTPVVCAGTASDDIAFNQQIVPTVKNSLILGREFTVSVKTEGTHINEKGYGQREYAKYVKDRQVCFPFPVLYAGQNIEAESWISLKDGTASFVLPVTVEEGDYEIMYRTIAVNAGSRKDTEQYANRKKDNYIASSTVPVTVVGRLYGFCITNIVDYPRWEDVFWKKGRKERTGVVYYSGTNDCNGVKRREKNDIFLIPLLKGSHPYDRAVHAPGLGYRAVFSIQTVGSMSGASDCIKIEPRYYYMDQNGKNLQRVNLYQKENLEQFYVPLCLTAKDRVITGKGMQTWSGSYQIPPDIYAVNAGVNLEEYITKKGKRIKQTDEVFLKDGYIIVSFSIRSEKEGNPHLDYENRTNIHNGYCDMWKTEGFLTERVDSGNTVFFLREGDVLVFDQAENMLTDYTSVGTH